MKIRMKITVYTITDCEFSKQEKEYLTSHQISFEEKNLETNKEFLTEMLVVSNNFAGTPVTKIEKDDGKIEILKGFTKEEFDKTLGYTPEEKKEEPPTGEKKPVEEMKKPEEQKPVREVKTEPLPSSGQAAAAPTPPAPTEQPITPVTPPVDSAGSPQANDPLNSILQDLQAKSVVQTADNQQPTSNSPTTNQSTPSQSPSLPSVPDFQNKP